MPNSQAAFDFRNKRVIVAGGSRGIGRAIALAFAGAGAGVSICARGAADLAAAQRDIGRSGSTAHAAVCNLADGAAVAGYVAEAAAALGGIDILVNNASGFGDTDDEAGWEASVSVDLLATVRASRAALPHIELAGGGSIINISSISGLAPSAESPPYGAVKAALVHYTATQAVTLAGKNVRVNCVAPGSIEFAGGYWGKCKSEDPKLYNRVLGGIPFGRYGRPEEIANVVLFLASPLASWITGQTLVADGGQMLNVG
jgi:3-oxoacyl-[acyl-carrier protein] reductase